METSPSIANISEALRKFQDNVPAVTKEARANYGKYATLGNMIDTVRPTLSEQGLTFSQLPDGEGLTTILMHKSGEWIKATGALVMEKRTPQGEGSAITYLRRYALGAILGIATEDDDDGNEASKPVKAPVAAKKAPTSAAAKKLDPITAKKLQIVALMKEIRSDWDAMTDEGKRDAIHNETDLEPTDENLPDIIARLEATLGK